MRADLALELPAALALFALTHVAGAASGVKTPLTGVLGRAAYGALYGLVSLALLAWIILAASRAPRLPLWSLGETGRMGALLCIAAACLLFASGARRPNPLSLSLRPGPPPSQDPGALALTRHPLLWSLALWSAGHLAVAGHSAGAMIFGCFLLLSLSGMGRLDRRAKARLSIAEFAAARAVTAGSLSARLARLARPSALLDAALAAALFAALAAAHGPVIGVWPLAGLW